jgi:hypothetical protein
VNGLAWTWTWRSAIPASVVALVAFAIVVTLARSNAPARQEIVGTPCPEASPAIEFPTAEATPPGAIIDSPCFVLTADLGNPIAAGDLTVTVEADDVRAGPRALTVTIVDSAGAPVAGATVTIRTRSLEMDHGVSLDEAVETAPGRYFAERVSLGMGGDWLAEITIARPDAEPVVLYVVISLEGPTH